MDREIVKTHLQIIHTWSEFARERDLQFFTVKHLEDIAQWADDAIALLNEHEGTINELQNAYGYLQKQFYEVQDKLLKEQEAVEPETRPSAKGFWFTCGACGWWLFEVRDTVHFDDRKRIHFCASCGRRVNWE